MIDSAPVYTRESPQSARLWISWIAYVVMVVWLATRHEMWRDEVRAFSVATRPPSLVAMLAELHHEGHPAIWYLLLRGAYAVTHSNLVLPGIAIAVSAITAFLILRYAPFPFWLRLLAVFGAFLGFELTIVARNYGVGVMLMIAACIAFRRRHSNPWLPAVCLALMANTSIHALLATLVLLFIWIADVLDKEYRESLKRRASIVAMLLVLVGVATAIMMSRPTPDMIWAFSFDKVTFADVVRAVFSDPGSSLRGFSESNIAAAAEFPWRYLKVDPGVASRIIVDLCLLVLAWSLRRRPLHLIALILTLAGFALLLREVYLGGPRHHGLLAFLVFSICWLAAESRNRGDASRSDAMTVKGQIAFGLLPLFAVQAAALPVIAHRSITKPESGSKAYGQFINSHSQYRDAILMSEPDYMMEALPYYVANRIYMARQNEFGHVVYFDKGGKRRQQLTMTELIQTADMVSCTYRSPVLLAIGYTEMAYKKSGVRTLGYRPASFRWTEAEWRSLGGHVRPVASFDQAVSDEYYHIVEVNPFSGGRCP